MIDLRLVREHPDVVRASQRARGADESLVDALLAADAARREAVRRADDLRGRQKEASQAVRGASPEAGYPDDYGRGFLAGFTAAPAKTVEPGPVTEAPAPPAPVEAEEDDADVEARLQKWVRWILAGDPPDEPLGRG